MNVLGIMNGTSLDGIDYVWLKFDKNHKFTFIKHKHCPLPILLKMNLKRASLNQLTSYELGELHHELGRVYQRQLVKLIKAQSFKTHLIGLHGQTVYHHGKVASLQIGEPSYLAESLKIPIIYNFRSGDIARGGEGAPFAPIFHQELLRAKFSQTTAFQNLGGLGNVTYCSKTRNLAFDTGPANVLMDLWSQTEKRVAFDKDGQSAARGLASPAIVKKFMTHSFFKKTPPKSCGREEFNLNFITKFGGSTFLKLNYTDQMATLLEFSVQSIYKSYRNFLPEMPKQIVFSGGGTKNKFLMKRLKIQFSGVNCLTSENLDWPTESIEAATFAFLAYHRWKNHLVNMKPFTGGDKGLLGQICL